MAEKSNGLAQAVEKELLTSFEEPRVVSDSEFESEETLEEEQHKSIFEKIRFSWTPEDQGILARIGATVDDEFARNFHEAIIIFDKFFGAMHVPQTQWVGTQETVITDIRGRVVYKTDSAGRLIEDYSQLTGQDFEEAILRLEKLRLDLRPRLSQLFGDAVYAKNCARDIHDDVYWATDVRTIDARDAKANIESRQERYHSFFRYRLWQTSKDFFDEIGQFLSYLDKIRTWKSFER